MKFKNFFNESLEKIIPYNKESHMNLIKDLDMEVFGDTLDDKEFDINKGLVIISENRLVGYIFWDDSLNIPHIRSMAVSSKYRGMGIGKKLMIKAMEKLGSQITLTLDNHNKDFLEKFYYKLGFRPTGNTNKAGNRIWAIGKEAK